MNYTQELVISTIENQAAEVGNYSKLAKKVGISQSTLSKWRRGQLIPQPETFFKYFPIEEPKTTSRPRKPAVETIFIANNSNDEIIRALCGEIKEKLAKQFRRCHVRVGTLDYHNVLVVSIEKKRNYYIGGHQPREYYFRQVYPDPIDHAYLDPDWAKVVASNFTKAADKWLLKQFKG